MAARPMALLTLSLVAGIILAPYIDLFHPFLIVLFCLFFLLNIVLFVFKKAGICAPIVMFLMLGGVIGLSSQNENLWLKNDTSVPTNTSFVSLEGYLTGFPIHLNRGTRLIINLEKRLGKDGWLPTSGKLQITVSQINQAFAAGERLAVLVRPRKPHNFENPGGFDYEAYLKAKKIVATATAPNDQYVISLGGNDRLWWLSPILRWRENLILLCRDILPAPGSGLMQAFILGELEALDDSVKEVFQQTGTGHLLAVSGLNMGQVALGAYFVILFLLKRSEKLILKVNVFRWAIAGSIPPLLFYTLISGLSFSAARAAIMAFAFILAFMLNRQGDHMSTVALSAVLIIAFEPIAPRDISFQLSFVAVVGILYVSPRFRNFTSTRPDSYRKKFIRGLHAGIIISVIAYVVTLPFIIHYFNRVSLVGIFTNLWTIPLTGFWVIPVGLCSALLFPIWPDLAGIGFQAAAWPLSFMVEALTWFASLPFSSLYLFTFNWVEVGIYIAFFFFLLNLKRIPYAAIFLGLTLITGVIDAVYWEQKRLAHSDLSITFLDVGQGNAALVQFPKGINMMIDGGGFVKSDFDTGKRIIAPYLWSNKIVNIDYVVCTHPDPDHINGLPFIAEIFHPKEIWTTGEENPGAHYSQLASLAKAKHINLLDIKHLQKKYFINGVELSILYPPTDFLIRKKHEQFRRLNNNSMVIRIKHGHSVFLLPADIEWEAEQELISMNQNYLKCDVLLSPHHGSITSSTPAFMKLCSPRIVLISVGANNWWGLPHSPVLNLYQTLGCKVYRTDLDGAITVTSDGDNISLQTWRRPRRSREG